MYFQPNSCDTHAEREWALGTFLRHRRKVPPAHAQQVYLEERAHTGIIHSTYTTGYNSCVECEGEPCRNWIYTRCTWAGRTESQFVVERKFTREIHNTSSKFNIRVNILSLIYVLMCTMLSSLVKRALLYQIFRTNIYLIIAEVLGFLVHQCVLSFRSHFQYGLLPLLTSRSSDQSINAILGSCK